MNAEMIVLMGVQASGKSSFYAAHYSRTHLRINLDMLKTRHRERVILGACLAVGQSIVIDNTNPTRAGRASYISLGRASGYQVKGFYFRSSIEEAIVRNLGREEDMRVPDIAIRGTGAKFEMPMCEEGFDDLFYCSIVGDGKFLTEEWKDEI